VSLGSQRPRTWGQLLALVRASAGLEAGEELPSSLWLQGMLEEVGGAWGLRPS
jgi:hypothetical protein